jgi:hypothetical protein
MKAGLDSLFVHSLGVVANYYVEWKNKFSVHMLRLDMHGLALSIFPVRSVPRASLFISASLGGGESIPWNGQFSESCVLKDLSCFIHNFTMVPIIGAGRDTKFMCTWKRLCFFSILSRLANPTKYQRPNLPLTAKRASASYSEPERDLLTTHNHVLFLLLDKLASSVCPTTACLLKLVHGITHQIQLFGAFGHLPLHVLPIAFLTLGGSRSTRSGLLPGLRLVRARLRYHAFGRRAVRTTNYFQVSLEQKGTGESHIPLRISISAGVTYCVPDTHWKLEIVGRGGIASSGLKRASLERLLHECLVIVPRAYISIVLSSHITAPVPQMFSNATSEGPVHPRMSPEPVITASGKRTGFKR